jgi:hypothetical protein
MFKKLKTGGQIVQVIFSDKENGLIHFFDLEKSRVEEMILHLDHFDETWDFLKREEEVISSLKPTGYYEYCSDKSFMILTQDDIKTIKDTYIIINNP